MSEVEKIQIEAFLDNDSETFSYVVYDSESKDAIVIDPVLDFDYASGKTYTEGATVLSSLLKTISLVLHGY
jgi:hypothetical protein